MTNEEIKHQPRGEKIKDAYWGNITNFAQALLDESKTKDVWGEFNGVVVEVEKSSTLNAEQVVQKWSATMEKQREDYKKSPEGISFAEKAETQRVLEQSKTDGMIRYIEGKNDNMPIKQMLDWLYDFYDYNDRTNLKIDRQKLVETIKRHGFEANVNLKEKFNKEDPDNFARYIIGQFMDCFSNNTPMPPSVLYFIEDWRKKFNN